jgi:hypothetical protein
VCCRTNTMSNGSTHRGAADFCRSRKETLFPSRPSSLVLHLASKITCQYIKYTVFASAKERMTRNRNGGVKIAAYLKLSCLHGVASAFKNAAPGQSGGIWKEAIVAYFKTLSLHLPRGTEVSISKNTSCSGGDLKRVLQVWEWNTLQLR